jgi:hypothetical protein
MRKTLGAMILILVNLMLEGLEYTPMKKQKYLCHSYLQLGFNKLNVRKIRNVVRPNPSLLPLTVTTHVHIFIR